MRSEALNFFMVIVQRTHEEDRGLSYCVVADRVLLLVGGGWVSIQNQHIN